MTGIAAFGLWLLTWAPNHQMLWAQIESADTLEHRLVPWREIVRPVLPVWLVWQPKQASPLGPATWLPAEHWQPVQALGLGRAERLLPQLNVPRLLLAENHFRAPSGGFKALEQLAPDSAERLLNALVGAHLHRRSQVNQAFAAELDARADALMSEVSAGNRRAAYSGALTEFVGHIFSISHEIGRHQRRRLARGETLCAAIGHPASLFGGWQRALEKGEYRGYRPVPQKRPTAAGSGPGGLRDQWRQTEAVLGRGDKDWILEQLNVAWSGEPEVDFRFLCHPP